MGLGFPDAPKEIPGSLIGFGASVETFSLSGPYAINPKSYLEYYRGLKYYFWGFPIIILIIIKAILTNRDLEAGRALHTLNELP